ncbi:hypothetical protein [Micromonospora inyonensis]|uniref:Uncharacterized protein n=1 Tax=Micromonospora inyonensis TaxID=47866 RepID=A0A1C6RCX7_9ACTN|nr:hypothetical protein [Micromonospora inyonensis]SCL15002.1 hypothetical protein GA0074694_1010 [Micromonospora inyonensis]SCL33430.1 hypothetical protein GA0074694_6226 [Micromonospora inyonensis]SCL33519.1 hypothetical protein GA0074694_6248 [Micromonospora inyonensis]
MDGAQQNPAPNRGEQIDQAEREAAKQRILALAEDDRVPVDDVTRAVPDRRWRRGR